MKIENDNMRNNWQKALKHTKFQEDKLAKVVKSPIRNKPFCKDSLIHLFEAIQNIDHDQQLSESKGVESILSFGFMSCINQYFKTISMFSLVLYDISNKKYLRFMCKPSVLANTIFIDDVAFSVTVGSRGAFVVRNSAVVHKLRDTSVGDTVFSKQMMTKNTPNWVKPSEGNRFQFYLLFLNIKAPKLYSEVDVCNSIFRFLLWLLKPMEDEYDSRKIPRNFASFELKRYLVRLCTKCELIPMMYFVCYIVSTRNCSSNFIRSL